MVEDTPQEYWDQPRWNFVDQMSKAAFENYFLHFLVLPTIREAIFTIGCVQASTNTQPNRMKKVSLFIDNSCYLPFFSVN
jgi:hypothetical protein